VTLADILDAAGIDIGSAQSFNFWTNDKQGGYYTSLTKTFLIDTPRYCYYSLPDNFDYDYGKGNEYAALDFEQVPTVIALADDWNRALAGASFGSDYMNLNTHTRFRLVYGQTDTTTRTASSSAKWIHSIEVTLGGAPTLTADESALEIEVGSRLRREARVQAADPVIAENAEIIWSSSDESVAAVDDTGEIIARSEGTTVITASFGGQSASMTITVNEKKSADGGESAATGGTAPKGDAESAEETGATGAGTVPEEAPDKNSAEEPMEKPAEKPTENPATNSVREPAEEPREIAKPASKDKRPSVIGHEISAVGVGGGVQNWRKDEMSESAVELPVIPAASRGGFAAAAVALLAGGGLCRLYCYRRDT
jgi:hypothetical protein